jgi:folylpolyglutamate synthase
MPTVKEVKRALARVKAAIPAQKKLETDRRNIRLGLERINRIVPRIQPWVGVHVGGTNGKGSICTMLSRLFRHAGISQATYMSPAMPERHNGITINGLYVNKRMYELEIEHTLAAYKRAVSGWTFRTGEDPGELTPFELETATAFRVFNKMHVQYGIVEVGMGGATDATNAMKRKGVTVISKIDLDHQEYLGNTIEEIATVKAGIMRPGVPCIVDHTNPSSVIDVLQAHAEKIGTQISLTKKDLPLLESIDTERFQLEDYEKQNLLCASLAFRQLFPSLDLDLNRLLASRPYPPGRKDSVYVRDLTDGARTEPVFVDGAHNLLGAQALSSYVDGKIREEDKPVTWVMGLSASKSKPFAKVIESLVRPQDNFAFVEYQPRPTDPPPAPAELGREIAEGVVTSQEQLYNGDSDIGSGVRWACEKAAGGPVVVTGSLYLIREFYGLDGVYQRRRTKTRRPGKAQLWHYTKLSQQRELTEEEEREFKQARRHWHQSPERRQFRSDEEGEEVPEEKRQAQRDAAFHKKQANAYEKALRSIDADANSTIKFAGNPEAVDKHQLQTMRQEHFQRFQEAMKKVRGYQVMSEVKYMSREQIFGRPKRAKTIGAAGEGKISATEDADEPEIVDSFTEDMRKRSQSIATEKNSNKL